ncbi:fimbrial protein [Parabacteroides johnsonii]|uniref:fimbrial protein n=1 Tax=Parabacteroides johnsonii TaxID=387661 RepID=UPI00307E379E
MLHKNIIKLAALLWCVLTVASCTNEDFDQGNNGPDVPEGLPVTLKLNIGTPEVPVVETKALDNGDTFGQINDLAVLVYDKDGKNGTVAYWKRWDDDTDQRTVEFSTKTGQHKMYVLTNTGSQSVAAGYATEADLLAAQFQASLGPTGKEMMLGFVAEGTDASKSSEMYEKGINTGVNVTTDGASYCARVVPPYSKVTFRITKNLPDMDKVYLNIHSVKVRKLPSVYTLMPFSGEGDSKLKPEQTVAAEIEFDIDEVQSNEGSFFYMYENKQGVYSNDRGPAYKSPGIDVPENADAVDYDTWFEKWDDLACTYIEVKGKYSIVKSQTSSSTIVDAGDINYRFFLGEDITSDFNICRNKSYIVTLDFSQEAGYGELKHEWRVHAKLDEATFLPEGDLVIDGYPQSLGYVPFYVSNGTSGNITLTTTGVSSADMNMYFNQNGYWSGSSAADFGNFKITANSLTEFAIAPNDVGILGEGRNYNQGSFSSVDNLNRRDEVARGDIYNTREYTMTFVTSGETKTSVLVVKELPLLLLTNTYSPSNKSTVYARRVDGAYLHPKVVEGGYSDGSRNEYFSRTTDKIRAQRICMGTGDYQNPYAATGIGNYLKSFLPTKAEIDKIIELEKVNPLKEAKYWTMDGLYDVTTKQLVSGNGEGYIRCVAKPL